MAAHRGTKIVAETVGLKGCPSPELSRSSLETQRRPSIVKVKKPPSRARSLRENCGVHRFCRTGGSQSMVEEFVGCGIAVELGADDVREWVIASGVGVDSPE